ncbi:hypothetical protein [Photobacterium arenosum]|uniref:hypothetical protein n=1 Tax=Photobacterium arenosum TaxID=2774143 RepID=UPI00288A51A0|nr:hypothetical protein [Photobacterium arenosum]
MFLARYPALADVPFTHTWGGVYAISRNFTNFFGQLDDRVYASACDNGCGCGVGHHIRYAVGGLRYGRIFPRPERHTPGHRDAKPEPPRAFFWGWGSKAAFI